MRSLVDDRNLVIKKAEKASCVIVLDQSDYFMEAGKCVRRSKLSAKLIQDLNDTSEKIYTEP